MSVTGQRMVGIPVVLLHEGEGLILTVETRNGWIYRGYCEKTKDNFNMKMVQVVATDDNGNQYHMSEVLLRGSTIRYVIFPDILRYSPMFKRVELRKKGIVVAGGLGRGRQQAIAKKVQKRAVESGRAMRGRGRGLPSTGRGAGPPGQAPPASLGYGQGRPAYGAGRPQTQSYGQPTHSYQGQSQPYQPQYQQQQQQFQQPQYQPRPPAPSGGQSGSGGRGAGRGINATLPHWASGK